MTGPDTRDTDLDRIESALADGRATAADPRERELQELALALRADSPEPAPEFARQLDKRVQEGFPKPARFRLPVPGFWIPALAAATVLIAVAAVALSSSGGGEEKSAFTAAEQPQASAGLSTSTARGGAPSAPLSAGSRRVERNARLTISAPADHLQTAADGIGTVAESHRGFVLSSNVNTGDATGDTGGPGGTFTLRVPQKELQATIADLTKLGHLRARNETGEDMTASFNQVQDRLGNALLERRKLKLKLRHAKGAKADAIRAEIAGINREVNGLNSQMRQLRSRTVFSTIYVALEQEKDGAGAGVGAAWHDAQDTLGGMLEFSVRALAVLLPLALLAALAALGTRVLRRRRREAPLL
jgi:ribosome-associated translation inhibitor RaiA